jgi:hypothetical protein
VSASEHQHSMKTPSRKQLREKIKTSDIGTILHVPRGTLTAKQKRFAEALVLEGKTGADAYRTAYDTKARPHVVGTDASKLKANPRVALEIQALEQAKQVAALHSAEALRSLVISTLTSAIIDPESKPATRITAAKILGQVTEVAAFTERKEITHVQDSGAIRSQILDQLKSMMLSTHDAQDVDATELLAELSAEEPHGGGIPPNAKRDSGADVHSNQLEQIPPESVSPESSEHPPSPSETQTPRGDIFGENDGDTNLT